MVHLAQQDVLQPRFHFSLPSQAVIFSEYFVAVVTFGVTKRRVAAGPQLRTAGL
jgi:hypothetical protein